jgi:hypothetical protein
VSTYSDLHPGGRHQGGEEYLIRLRALPSDVPPIIHLRHALKRFLRDYDLRCRSVEDVTPALPPLPPQGEATTGLQGDDLTPGPS